MNVPIDLSLHYNIHTSPVLPTGMKLKKNKKKYSNNKTVNNRRKKHKKKTHTVTAAINCNSDEEDLYSLSTAMSTMLVAIETGWLEGGGGGVLQTDNINCKAREPKRNQSIYNPVC